MIIVDLSTVEYLLQQQKRCVLFRRGLVATKSIPSRAVITSDMVTAKRPATGVKPMHLEIIIGRKILREWKPEKPEIPNVAGCLILFEAVKL